MKTHVSERSVKVSTDNAYENEIITKWPQGSGQSVLIASEQKINYIVKITGENVVIPDHLQEHGRHFGIIF
jgi:hypothetical protein